MPDVLDTSLTKCPGGTIYVRGAQFVVVKAIVTASPTLETASTRHRSVVGGFDVSERSVTVAVEFPAKRGLVTVVRTL